MIDQPTFKILKLMYFNSRSLFKKIDDLAVATNFYSPDIIMICESWLNKNTSNSMISIPGYVINNDLRRDREDTRMGAGGGLIVHI